MGAVSSIGGDPEAIFGALCAGRGGLAELRAFDRGRFRATAAYEIDDRPEPGGDEPGRATRWLCDAIRQALDGAGMDHDLTGVPVLVGTTFREQRSVELWWRGQAPLAPSGLYFGPALRAEFGCTVTYTPASACAASLYGMAMATDLIALGQAETVVVAGTDALTESAFGAIDRVQNRVPRALRPLDRDRSGMLMGEGAVAVVVRASGGHHGPVAGRVRGVGLNCDGHHATRPSGPSIGRAIRDAHARAGVKAGDIDLVMLHGTGTPLNDATEMAALAEVFAGRATLPYVTAIKSMTGHTCGGSGLLSLVTALLAIGAGRIPPIAGLAAPIEEAAGFGLPIGCVTGAELRTVQIDAFGFGGLNAVAVVEGAPR
ncbi:beta-ketoacyl-[acyl-carrier-protein] synthase family protein [Actinomadura fibrosa]|uniref:Beta-ketoacyl-[acyl-carrier-protein] synthase family protein n=1 Tax=Actinomadura fibrosa TaxID=111802 RepID=A0ABW2XWU0_9ACTN|nr:beta-ketoacyl synthase N-terminal-like domain-containing protein [Actinomadura fibrosa]